MSAPLSDWTDDIPAVETRMTVHEAVCAERYASILAMLRDTAHRVTRLEVMVLAAAGSTILGMAGLVATLALRLGKGG
jgi:hypothetical protein